MDEDEEMPATLEDPAADEEETRALVEAFEAEQAAQEAQVRDRSRVTPDQPSVTSRPAMLEHVSALVGVLAVESLRAELRGMDVVRGRRRSRARCR